MNDQSNKNHDVGNEITCNPEVLISNLVRCNIIVVVVGTDGVTQAEFKNYAEFIKY